MIDHLAPVPLKEWHKNGHAVLGQYGFFETCALDLFSFSENATYKVTEANTGRTVVLRLSRPGYRSLTQIQSEIAWIKALRDAGIARTPPVLDTLTGEPVAAFKDCLGTEQYATVFGFADGEMLDATNAICSFEELGEIAGRLHSHSADWIRPVGFDRPQWGVETALSREGHWGYWGNNETLTDEDRTLLERVDRKIRRDIAEYGYPSHRYGLIHGDMRLANFIVDAEGIALIDFDDCGDSWHLYELACALSFIEDSPDAPDLVSAWLKGYNRIRPLEAPDMAVLPAMVMMRRLLLIGWFTTHTHVLELQTLASHYVRDTRDIATAFLSENYLSDL
jgi:Ser/Thr protein kinase RdoA (MazF antagonist)